MPVDFDDLTGAGTDPAVVAAFRGLSDDLTAIRAALDPLLRPGLRPARMDDLARIAAELHRLRVAVSGQSGAGALALDAKGVADRVAALFSGLRVEVTTADDGSGPGGSFDPEAAVVSVRVPPAGQSLDDEQVAALERVPDMESADDRTGRAAVLTLDLGEGQAADLLVIAPDGLEFVPSKSVADLSLERGEIGASPGPDGAIDLITINGAAVMRLHPDRPGEGGDIIRGGIEIVAYQG